MHRNVHVFIQKYLEGFQESIKTVLIYGVQVHLYFLYFLMLFGILTQTSCVSIYIILSEQDFNSLKMRPLGDLFVKSEKEVLGKGAFLLFPPWNSLAQDERLPSSLVIPSALQLLIPSFIPPDFPSYSVKFFFHC